MDCNVTRARLAVPIVGVGGIFRFFSAATRLSFIHNLTIAVSLLIAACPMLHGQPIAPPVPEIVSAWKLNSENVVVIFRHDGVFYFIDGMTGHLGMERGTYEWDKATSAFSVNVVVDTNDDAGFSHPGATTTISIIGNTLNYTVVGEGTFPFTRLVNTGNAIVGSWHLPGEDANLTFLGDGTYYHSEESDNEPFSTNGMERGTYTWNSGTGALTANLITDTNGESGLSNPTPSFNAIITGNSMSLFDGQETYILRRITPNIPLLNTQSDFEVDQFANHRQSSAAAPALLPVPVTEDHPFWGEAYIENTITGSGGTLTVTGQTSKNFVDDDGWSIEREYNSLAALNAANAFPNGTNYTFSRTGGSATLSYPADGTFPPAPIIVGAEDDGTWSNGIYILGQNQTLIWNAHTAFSPSSLVTVLSVFDQATGGEIMHEEVIQGDIVSYDFRGRLTEGVTYDVILEHVKIASSTTSGTGPFAGKLGYALYNSNTRFSMALQNQEVHTVVAWKQKISEQQSSSLLTPIGAAFSAGIEGSGISATFPSSTITITKPDNSSTPFELDGNRWDFSADFATFSALQTAFPDGIYKINIGTDQIPITVSGASYPNQPLISASSGTWANNKLRITASQAAAGFTLTSNSSSGNGFETLVLIDIATDNDILHVVNHEPSNPAFLTATIAPSQLTAGKSYEVEVEFDQVVHFTTLEGKTWGTPPAGTASAFGLLSSTTVFTIEVVADEPAVVEFVIAVKDVRHMQTGPSTVILDTTPVSPMNGGPFGFGASVQGQNMASLPPPTVTPPAGTPSTSQDPFYSTLFFDDSDDEFAWRYGPNANDWGDLTQAAIDTRFPNGTYTFLVNGVSVPLSLTGNSYPNIPQLMLTGGSWINGKYAMDASNALTVVTNIFTGYGANVDGRIGLGINDSGVEYFRSSSPTTNFATLTTPANFLPPNEITHIDAEFSAIVSKSNAIPGAYCAALYERQLEIEVHILPKIITQSTSQVLPANAAVDLQISGTGSPATTSGQLDYQWKKNGVNMPGLTSPSFSLPNFTVNDAATYTCTVSNDVGSVTSQPIYLEFADPFRSYTAGFGLNSVTTGAPGADFDNDGLPNLLEYLLGGNPTLPSNGLLPAITKAPASSNLVFTYKRKIASTGVNQVIEHSTNLSNTWSSAIHGQNGVTIVTTAVPGDATREQVTATIPSTSTSRFVRLKANR